MKKILAMVFMVAIATSCASVKNVAVDYAHDFDFSAVETYQYLDTENSNSKNPLMADRIVALINKELQEGGLTEVDENPDIVVTYHITSEENTRYNTTTVGYGGYGGWGPGWRPYRYGRYGGVGVGTSTTYATNYVEGTLILDAFDPATKKVIWRGIGTVTVKDSSQKQTQQVESVLAAIGAKWDKILKGQGE